MNLLRLIIEDAPEDLERKLRGIHQLVLRGATDGEKANAAGAYERLGARFKELFGADKWARVDSTIKSPPAEPRSGPRSGFKPDAWWKPKTKRPEDKQPDDKLKHRLLFQGWLIKIWRLTDPSAGERGSDKVWGFAYRYNGEVTAATIFWGRYGKTLSYTQKPLFATRKIAGEKQAKGYMPVMGDTVTDQTYKWFLDQVRAW